jgi:23S rRNA-intervening sequence protein
MSVIENYRQLEVYQNAMRLTMRVFELTRTFPAEEKYSLTDQIQAGALRAGETGNRRATPCCHRFAVSPFLRFIKNIP